MVESGFPPDLLDALRELEAVLPIQEDLARTLTKVSEVSVRLIPGCDSASITLADEGSVRTPGASDQLAIDLDMVQYRTNTGPCLEVIEKTQTVQVDDLEAENRWPDFSKKAVELGFLSSYSVPIKVDGVSAGLNMYGRSKKGFEAIPRELVDLLVSRTSVTIENARVYGASQSLVEQLNEAVKTREIIGEAKGILMARESVSEDAAFQMLVTISQNTNMKLREIAQKMVDEATA